MTANTIAIATGQDVSCAIAVHNPNERYCDPTNIDTFFRISLS